MFANARPRDAVVDGVVLLGPNGEYVYLSDEDETRTVEARRGQTTIRLAIGSDVTAVNGVPFRLDYPPHIPTTGCAGSSCAALSSKEAPRCFG